MDKFTRFIKTAVTYFLGSILSKIITFFLLPLYTNRILPEQYGNYDLANTIITLFVSLSFFQIWDGMFRFAFDYKEEIEKYRIISMTFVVFAFGILIYMVLFFVANYFLSFLYGTYAMVYGVVLGLQYLYTFMARVFLKNKLFVFSGTANTVIVAISNIILIVGLKWDVRSLFLSQILGCIAQIVIIELSLRSLNHIKLKKIDKNIIVSMLKFSVPLCISTISYWLLSGFTKLAINNSLGSYENGIYAAANALANVAVIAVNVFQYAWNEMTYIASNENNKNGLYQKGVGLLILTVSFGYAVICLLVKLFFNVVIGPDYWSAKEIVPILMLGVAANAVAGFLGTLFMTEKKTGYILSSTFIAAFINILFCKLITNRFELIGAVTVLSVSFGALMFIRLFQLHNHFQVFISPRYVLCFVPILLAFFMYSLVESEFIILLTIFLMCVGYLIYVSKKLGIKIRTLHR